MGQAIEDLKLEEEIKQEVQIEDFTQRSDNMSVNGTGTELVSNTEKKEEYSKEDLLSIYSGKRPEHIPYEVYKAMRNYFKVIDNTKKKGTMGFISNGFPMKNKDGEEVIKYLPKGRTYTKQQLKEDKNENM